MYSDFVATTSSLVQIQQTLDNINANIQYTNNLNYFFIVIVFTILVCCLFYKLIKNFF